MKKIIDKKVYDTETSTLVAQNEHGRLYKTNENHFFIHVPVFVHTCIKSSYVSSDIIPLSYTESCNWLEEHDMFSKEIEKYFFMRNTEG